MEKRYFSVSKLIDAINTNTIDAESYEYQTNEANKRSLGIDNKRSISLTKEDLNYNAWVRAYGDGFHGTITGTPVSNGGELIHFDYRPGMYAGNLRPQLTLDKTGYFEVTSPNGRPIEWPICTSGINAGMVDLDGNLPSGDMTWKTIKLQGKKIGAITQIPYSLLTQSAPKADEKIEEDLVKALYQVRDEKVFTGVGTTVDAYEPLGILNNPECNQLTAAFTWKTMLDAENLIREANIFSDNLAFVMNGKTYVELCTTGKLPAASGFVYGFICENDKIKNFPVYVNNVIPDNKIILGDFNELVVCDFEGLEILADPYTGLANNQVRVAGWMQMDSTVQRPKAFTVITKAS